VDIQLAAKLATLEATDLVKWDALCLIAAPVRTVLKYINQSRNSPTGI
jgi:hypothetical protein